MVCPFLEQDDDRCATHFTVHNLDDAFHHCFGRHESCPVYDLILRSRPRPISRRAVAEAIPATIRSLPLAGG